MLTQGPQKQTCTVEIAPSSEAPPRTIERESVTVMFHDLSRAVLTAPARRSTSCGWTAGQAVDSIDFSQQLGQLKISLAHANACMPRGTSELSL
jgi:hypothetical protein